MSKTLNGDFQGKGKRIGIAVSRFNAFITERLLDGAKDGLVRHGVNEKDVTVAWVPGAFDLPLVLKKMAASEKYDAIIALGCVIRGATAHFDYVAGEAAKGIGNVALSAEIPVIFGVLTTDTIEQAIERAGTKSGNKGFDAAMAAIEMANLMEKL